MSARQVRVLGGTVVGAAFVIAGSAVSLLDAAAGAGMVLGGVVGSAAWVIARTVRS